MTSQRRVSRERSDIDRELVEQLVLLKNDCVQYDAGVEASGKRRATALRVLLHLSGRSKSLLQQLGHRGGSFLDTAGPIGANSGGSEFNLLVIQWSQGAWRIRPLVAAGGDLSREETIPFEKWWTDPVIRDLRGSCFSRCDLVLHVADTDGGAHVDADLAEDYMALTRLNSIGAYFELQSEMRPVRGRIELACMRQIAHEVLATLHLRSEPFSAAASPVIPKESHGSAGSGINIYGFEVTSRQKDPE